MRLQFSAERLTALLRLDAKKTPRRLVILYELLWFTVAVVESANHRVGFELGINGVSIWDDWVRRGMGELGPVYGPPNGGLAGDERGGPNMGNTR